MSPGTRSARPRRCSIASALAVIGEKWSLLIVRELFLGVRRFNDIAANTGAPRDILTARLRRLEELGVVRRHVYSERPPRHEYWLTEAGRELRPVIMALKQWGDDHLMTEPLPLVLEHSCGEEFRPRTHCAACGEQIDGPSLAVREQSH
ncbi:MAG: winged helix-turn-helix transcriptional regulator [Actinomycetes bacterium]